MIVCDETGTIVKATARERVGQKHAGAQRILRGEVDDAAVTADEAAANALVREGYSCPVVVDGQRVATFGITGPLERTRPVARVAALVLAAWVKELRHQQALHEVAARVFATVDGLGARAQDAAREAVATGEASARAARDAAEQVERAGQVVDVVQRIAQQSRILSINGAVEATRAGDSGRSFGVVSKEMTRLADETKGTSAEIQATLGEIGAAIRGVGETVSRSARTTTEQARTLQEVTAMVTELKGAIARLEKSFGDART
jgi:hypothetical protein